MTLPPLRTVRVTQTCMPSTGNSTRSDAPFGSDDVYWIEVYGGGVFVPFRDATSGSETYGAGRYLLDTIKGADLGGEGDRLILDFNYAYNPSCAYDPRWSCPLAPAVNWLQVPIQAGERYTTHQ